MATAKGIKIPVSLELSNLQSVISTFQNVLKDIDPGSSLYKSIERGVEKAKRVLVPKPKLMLLKNLLIRLLKAYKKWRILFLKFLSET